MKTDLAFLACSVWAAVVVSKRRAKSRETNQLVWASQKRIRQVSHRYCRLAECALGRPDSPTTIWLLLASGATELLSEFEIEEVCRRIAQKRGQHPNCIPTLAHARLLPFLKFCDTFEHPIRDAVDLPFALERFGEQENARVKPR